MKTGMSLDDFLDYFGIDRNDDFESSTVNGWLSEMLGHIPQEGECTTYERLSVLVIQADDLMTQEVEIRVDTKPEQAASDTEE